jgi:hypothetical protein
MVSPFRAYYDHKRAEGEKHNAARICLARRRVAEGDGAYEVPGCP